MPEINYIISVRRIIIKRETTSHRLSGFERNVLTILLLNIADTLYYIRIAGAQNIYITRPTVLLKKVQTV